MHQPPPEVDTLSPIDNINTRLVDSFVQRSLPDILAPLQATLTLRMTHPCRLALLWLDAQKTRIASRIDANGHEPISAENTPCRIDESVTLRECLAQDRPARQPNLKDPVIAWLASDTCLPLVCLPLRRGKSPLGFLVIMHRASHPLNEATENELMTWLPMAASLVVREIDAIFGLFGAVRFARDFTLMRDTETGQHQLRLGGYAGLLAERLQSAHGLGDRFAPEIALYAPLHDIGKIGIPDEILLKPGSFDASERETMQAHVTKGSALIDRLIDDFGLTENPRIDTLRSIVAFHHEYLDGSGYPEGRMGDDIPLATRIITVSDIFDALTNVRAYKKPWSIDEAFDQLRKMAGKQLDKECVDAFVSERKQLTSLWNHYAAHGV
ncbi:HD-GYP domain-containing protein [Nitrogeniibacter aestuarii]|uniref:HD-GYP domain-containing protein n=1 Tax=Nitrogeniibacter aestuarii TaxID=2815343 RepID=UPI001E3239E6|nr:HD domain-containing phosphohydrolase [Nitrogeniibacter aestuarii]